MEDIEQLFYTIQTLLQTQKAVMAITKQKQTNKLGQHVNWMEMALTISVHSFLTSFHID